MLDHNYAAEITYANANLKIPAAGSEYELY